jgi:hypothetical protein
MLLGIGGLWFRSLPMIPSYIPPSPGAHAMLERAMQQADEADRAEHCRNDEDF